MKNLFFFLVMSILCGAAGAQSGQIDSISKLTVDKTPVFEPRIKSGKQLYLNMTYGKPEIANPEELKKIQGASIAEIDIVYTDHPVGQDLSGLTRKRLENLQKLRPELFLNKNIRWRIVAQTQFKDQATARQLFHGIVITYRPAQSKEEAAKEVSYIKDMLSKYTKKSEPVAVVKSVAKKKLESDYILDSAYTRAHGLTYIFSEGDEIFAAGNPGYPDSTVQLVLKRNKWTDMSIIADVTGSMSPYTAQLFIWLKLNTMDPKVKQFIFFNDGDMTPDHMKKIGKTGGIYHTRSAKFEDVEKLAYTAMSRGCGGDSPENNVEATLKALELCPECKNIVLIADNWAPVKDFSLVKSIKKPVKIILCGTDYGINPQYLDLAKETGGSVHTMKKDLTNLMNMKEGETLSIGGLTFKIEKGKFVRLTSI